jgi:hypothetical protein
VCVETRGFIGDTANGLMGLGSWIGPVYGRDFLGVIYDGRDRGDDDPPPRPVLKSGPDSDALDAVRLSDRAAPASVEAESRLGPAMGSRSNDGWDDGARWTDGVERRDGGVGVAGSSLAGARRGVAPFPFEVAVELDWDWDDTLLWAGWEAALLSLR